MAEQHGTNLYYSDPPFLSIDNASTLYAASHNKYWSRTYRIAVVLDREIDGEKLKQALSDTLKRFPTFGVLLREGMFWNYFERTSAQAPVKEEDDYPYRPVPITDTDKPPFRILYYKRRIAYEGFHSLSDGTGAGKFLKTLTARYLELDGEEISFDNDTLNVSDKPLLSETGDSYYKYADASVGAENAEAQIVYNIENEPIAGYSSIIHGLFTVEDIKKISKAKNLTITEYLTALLILTAINCEKEPVNKNISVSVPVDLRQRFQSESVRNFCFMTDVSFNPQGRKDIAFDEICDSIRGKLAQKASKEELLTAISKNVSAASSPVLKIVPYKIKRAFLKKTYRKVQLSYSLFFSNLGEFRFPAGVKEHVVRVESVLGDSPYLHFGCSAVSFNGLFNFTFSSGNTDTEKQRFFFRFLASQGLKIRIESNDSFSEQTMPEVNK